MLPNKKMKIFVLCILSIMIVSFVIAGIISATTNFTNTNLKDVNVNKSFAVSELKDISIKTVSTDISILPSEDKEIKMHYYGKVSEKNNISTSEIISEVSGSTLNIREKHKFLMISFGSIFNHQVLKLDVYIPKSYLKDINTGTVSGDVEINGININTLKINTTSGEINIDSVVTKTTDVNTVSGDMNADGFSGGLDFTSVSGDIDVMYVNFNNDIKVKTTSGDSKFRIQKNSQFSIDFNSVSGDFVSDFSMTQVSTPGRHGTQGNVGNSSNEIDIKSVSGDAKINEIN